MKPIKLHMSKCEVCQKEVATINMVRWSGKLYGKGCFSKHIKPTILAKKLEGQEFYKLLNKTVIEVIAVAEFEDKNHFTNSIQYQAQKGFISDKQISLFIQNLTFSERVKLVENVLDIIVNKETASNGNIETKVILLLGKHIPSSKENDYKRIFKTDKSTQHKALCMLSDLYTNNENFKLFVDSQYTAKIAEFCLELGLFKKYEEKLEEKVDQLYEVK